VLELCYPLGSFAGFSASAVSSRINDSECKMVITSDGGYRGNKTIELKV
jgi:acetyl-CoA synthetase